MFKKVVIIIAIAIVVISSVALPALANTNSNLRVIYIGSDRFYNYDFVDGFAYVGQSNHVDQPVTIVYSGNTPTSSVSKTVIKNVYTLMGFRYTGSTMYNKLDDGNGIWSPNSDGGKKTSDTDQNGYHFRLYAANGSYMTDPGGWNKYVIATTHKDLTPLIAGWSEDCENFICAISSGGGWTVYQDMYGFSNRDWPGRWEGVTQYWQCDRLGFANTFAVSQPLGVGERLWSLPNLLLT